MLSASGRGRARSHLTRWEIFSSERGTKKAWIYSELRGSHSPMLSHYRKENMGMNLLSKNLRTMIKVNTLQNCSKTDHWKPVMLLDLQGVRTCRNKKHWYASRLKNACTWLLPSRNVFAKDLNLVSPVISTNVPSCLPQHLWSVCMMEKSTISPIYSQKNSMLSNSRPSAPRGAVTLYI